MLRPPPRSPLFPYTTLFRSADRGAPPGRPAGALPHGGAPGIAGDLGRFRLLRAGQPERRPAGAVGGAAGSTRCHRSEEHTSELQSRPHLVCRLLLEKKKHICPFHANLDHPLPHPPPGLDTSFPLTPAALGRPRGPLATATPTGRIRTDAPTSADLHA